jgi:very-short-patch-repair endonuclease
VSHARRDASYHHLAVRQHGLVTLDQLQQDRMSSSSVSRWRRDGYLRAVHPGVFLVGGSPLTESAELLAACLAVDGVASHESAASLWGLAVDRPDRPHVSIDQMRRYQPVGVRIHRSKDLDRCGAGVRCGIPVTGIDRTVLDLGLPLGRHRLEAVAEDAVRRRLTTWDALTSCFLVHARRGRGGVAAMRHVLQERAGLDGRLESRLETLAWKLLARSGLPMPEAQVDVFDRGVFVARVDLAYVDVKIAIELDGKETHLTAEAFEADRVKRERLRRMGWIVLEFTWDMVVNRPGYVITTVRRALAGRAS